MGRRFLQVLICAFFAMPYTHAQGNTPAGPKVLSEDAKTEIVQAVEDEIYDYGLERKFRSIGKAIGDDEFEIPLFVTADSSGSSYYVIYRLMPYGELYRLVTIGDDGVARLFRNPRSGFPPDAPAMQTVYVDDEHVCELKHGAVRVLFLVNMNPSSERVTETISRQTKRYGFSNLEEQRAKRAKQGHVPQK